MSGSDEREDVRDVDYDSEKEIEEKSKKIQDRKIVDSVCDLTGEGMESYIYFLEEASEKQVVDLLSIITKEIRATQKDFRSGIEEDFVDMNEIRKKMVKAVNIIPSITWPIIRERKQNSTSKFRVDGAENFFNLISLRYFVKPYAGKDLVDKINYSTKNSSSLDNFLFFFFIALENLEKYVSAIAGTAGNIGVKKETVESIINACVARFTGDSSGVDNRLKKIIFTLLGKYGDLKFSAQDYMFSCEIKANITIPLGLLDNKEYSGLYKECESKETKTGGGISKCLYLRKMENSTLKTRMKITKDWSLDGEIQSQHLELIKNEHIRKLLEEEMQETEFRQLSGQAKEVVRGFIKGKKQNQKCYVREKSNRREEESSDFEQ